MGGSDKQVGPSIRKRLPLHKGKQHMVQTLYAGREQELPILQKRKSNLSKTLWRGSSNRLASEGQ
eukprot:6156552-Ditylum_brightwellii.AAC.1